MNCIYKGLLSLLFTVMMITKVAMPVMQVYKSSMQSDIEQQEQKTSEEGSEKAEAEKAKTEFAEWSSSHFFLVAQSSSHSFYQSYFISLLPARYFSVPTPPPWSSC